MTSSLTRDTGTTIVVDQQQLIVDTSEGMLAIGGNSEQKLAQVVTAGMSGYLSEIRLPVSGSSGELIVAIEGVTAGKPNGTVLTSEKFPSASLPPPLTEPPGFQSLSFSTPAFVSAGEPFAIVLTATGAFSISPGPVGDPYPRGDGFFDARPNRPGVWERLTNRSDLPFQTALLAPPQPSLWDMSLTRLAVLIAALLVVLYLIK